MLEQQRLNQADDRAIVALVLRFALVSCGGHGGEDFPGGWLALNSLNSSGLIIAILAMRGPRDVYGEFLSGGGGTLLAGAAVGKTVVAMAGTL